MYEGLKLKAPFFEVGPKAYLYGERAVKLAKWLDHLSVKYDVDIIYTPQYTDIPACAAATERLFVFAQHMDPLPVGRGLGSVLPEAVKAAGAKGVMLNHAERPVSMDVLEKTIARADEVGLGTIVCADTVEDVKTIAKMGPNLIVAEPTELIGTGQTSDMGYVLATIEAVRAIDPRIMVLQGAGISDGTDVYKVIRAGAMATGSTSGIIKNPDPEAMAEEMISAVRRAWNERYGA